MESTLTDLNAEQKTKLSAATADYTTKINAWAKTSQAALLAVQPQYTPGQVAYDSEIIEFNAEQAKQNALRDEVVNEAEAKMLAILTPAQAEKWASAQLSSQFTTRFGTLNITPEQKIKADAIVAEFAKRLAVAKDKSDITAAKVEFASRTLGLLDQQQVALYQQSQAPAAGRGGAGRGRGAGSPPSAAALQSQAEAYSRLFAIFLKHQASIDRVTFWGLNDARSWRTGQSPLLFDAQNKRKPAYNAVVEAALKPAASN
jgi:GH35 family endo-1,4-beta-xylanase